MPYYVFKISPGPTDLVKNLEQLAVFDTFREAKQFARDKRVELGITYESEVEIKMILAENPLEAEEKLQEKRERPILQEWEK